MFLPFSLTVVLYSASAISEARLDSANSFSTVETLSQQWKRLFRGVKGLLLGLSVDRSPESTVDMSSARQSKQ
jgi:hypothetical protein